MREQTSTLRPNALRVLNERYEAIAGGGRGHTVFVAGDDGAGRGALLEDWVAGLAPTGPSPYVVGGALAGGSYSPWESDAGATDEALSALQEHLSAAEPALSPAAWLLPAAVAKLLGQVLSKSEAALRVACRELEASAGEAAWQRCATRCESCAATTRWCASSSCPTLSGADCWPISSRRSLGMSPAICPCC